MKKVTEIPNGPYKLEGMDELNSANGKVETKAQVFLCRCGESSNKPFCDGTHSKVGFTSDKEADRVEDRLDDYQGNDIQVSDNRGLCAHAGYCTNQRPKTFRHADDGSFVDPNADAVNDIQETINQCPSGALNYSSGDASSKKVSEGLGTSVFVVPNGPYSMKNVSLEGNEWPKGADQNRFTLCRCGKSKNKPFCNGAHWYHHFDESTEPTEWTKTKSGTIK